MMDILHRTTGEGGGGEGAGRMHMQARAVRLCLRDLFFIAKRVKFGEIQASLNFVPESCSFLPAVPQSS